MSLKPFIFFFSGSTSHSTCHSQMTTINQDSSSSFFFSFFFFFFQTNGFSDECTQDDCNALSSWSRNSRNSVSSSMSRNNSKTHCNIIMSISISSCSIVSSAGVIVVKTGKSDNCPRSPETLTEPEGLFYCVCWSAAI